jgi:hypothetical protein
LHEGRQPRLIQPAIPTDVAAGRAIFSPAGEGKVLQGKWVRYYGFVGSHDLTRVPADEVEVGKE